MTSGPITAGDGDGCACAYICGGGGVALFFFSVVALFKKASSVSVTLPESSGAAPFFFSVELAERVNGSVELFVELVPSHGSPQVA